MASPSLSSSLFDNPAPLPSGVSTSISAEVTGNPTFSIFTPFSSGSGIVRTPVPTSSLVSANSTNIASPTTTTITPTNTPSPSITPSSGSGSGSTINPQSGSRNTFKPWEIGTIAAASFLLVLGAAACIWLCMRHRRRKNGKRSRSRTVPGPQGDDSNEEEKFIYTDESKGYGVGMKGDGTIPLLRGGGEVQVQIPSLHGHDSDVESQYEEYKAVGTGRSRRSSRHQPQTEPKINHEERLLVHHPPDVLHDISLDDDDVPLTQTHAHRSTTPTPTQAARSSSLGPTHPAALMPAASLLPAFSSTLPTSSVPLRPATEVQSLRPGVLPSHPTPTLVPTPVPHNDNVAGVGAGIRALDLTTRPPSLIVIPSQLGFTPPPVPPPRSQARAQGKVNKRLSRSPSGLETENGRSASFANLTPLIIPGPISANNGVQAASQQTRQVQSNQPPFITPSQPQNAVPVLVPIAVPTPARKSSRHRSKRSTRSTIPSATRSPVSVISSLYDPYSPSSIYGPHSGSHDLAGSRDSPEGQEHGNENGVEGEGLDNEDEGSDADSASIYSQASASTQRTRFTMKSYRQSSMGVPQGQGGFAGGYMPTIPQSPAHHLTSLSNVDHSAAEPLPSAYEHASASTITSSRRGQASAPANPNSTIGEATGTSELERTDTLRVARLLKSRQFHSHSRRLSVPHASSFSPSSSSPFYPDYSSAPTIDSSNDMSSSLVLSGPNGEKVEHIERKGSIRPARYLGVEGRDGRRRSSHSVSRSMS